jgi:hypothetical protein
VDEVWMRVKEKAEITIRMGYTKTTPETSLRNPSPKFVASTHYKIEKKRYKFHCAVPKSVP